MAFRRLLFVYSVSAYAALSWAPVSPPDSSKPARVAGLYATIQTSAGDITVRFYEQECPLTVTNFVDLSLGRKSWRNGRTGQLLEKPLYNGLTFHRVIKGFMIQGGDPQGDGNGGTDVIPDEFHPSLRFDVPGRLAMANSGPGTGSCQFFITQVPTPHLNGRHTIFGQVVEGLAVVGRIAGVPTDAKDRPLLPVTVRRVSVWREGPTPHLAPTDDRKPSPARRRMRRSL